MELGDRSPELLEIQKVERILAGKKQFEQAAAVQRQAAELEKKEREKHRMELGDRLSILDQTLVEKEEAEAAAHGRRVLENLWEMGFSNRLPLKLQLMAGVCSKIFGRWGF